MAFDSKIKDLDELAVCLAQLKAEGKRIVQSHGVFDLLHIGHIRHFEAAKSQGDVLVVTLTPDQYVNKGPHRPAFDQDLRAQAIASLAMVDFVAINRWPMAVETIALLKPDIYAKGSDYKATAEDITGGITLEMEAVQAVGGKICFTDEISFSSSRLLNEHFSPFPVEVENYLSDFRRRHSIDEVLEWLDRAAQLRPLVVGEAILDEYTFCDVIGKSTKDPVLAVSQQSVETYAGGGLAVANHLAGLCEHVGVITQLGQTERREGFVSASLLPNVEPIFLTKSDAPTIHKRRVVDRYSGNKLLEIYLMDDRLTAGEDARALNATLMQDIKKWDLTVVADYGHGFLTSEAISLLSTTPFLAVNVQSNAGNRGFNPVSKYRRADYVCLAQHEVNVETRCRDGNVRDQLLEIARRVACPRFTITRGKYGSLHYDVVQGWNEAPALTTHVVDRVGAGDSVLAITSLLTHAGAPWDIVAFVGNVAGAHMVTELGNRVTLERVALSKHIVSLMK